MSEYNLNLNVKIQADDLAAAYAAVSILLAEIKTLGEITKVDIAEPKSDYLSGHKPGCRATPGTRTACTCVVR